MGMDPTFTPPPALNRPRHGRQSNDGLRIDRTSSPTAGGLVDDGPDGMVDLYPKQPLIPARPADRPARRDGALPTSNMRRPKG